MRYKKSEISVAHIVEAAMRVLARQGYARTSLMDIAKEVGMSLTQYRNRCRLERFVELHVEQPELSLMALALEAGFGSYPQFHRIFKQHMGYPPAEHRVGYPADDKRGLAS